MPRAKKTSAPAETVTPAITGTPATLPLVPLRGILIFPGTVVPFGAGRPRSVAAIHAASGADGRLALVAQRVADAENVESAEELVPVGVVARIIGVETLENGTLRVMVRGEQRFALDAVSVGTATEIGPDGEVAAVEEMIVAAGRVIVAEPVDAADPAIPAVVGAIRDRLGELVATGLPVAPEIVSAIRESDDPSVVADLVAHLGELAEEDRLALLCETALLPRLEKAAAVIAKQLQVAKIRGQIASEVRAEFSKGQREAILREQMRAIAKELGDDEASDAEEFRKKIAESKLPEGLRPRVEREIARFARTPAQSAESGVIRTYLDWIFSLPWGTETEDNLDLTAARTQIDADHYGLDKIKERIVEYLAVRKVSPGSRSPILCFDGPPGVGKTSLGKSIATALGRKYARMSLGGISDEAEIRGHRRTYVGSMPGRFLRALRDAGTMNPVIILDEVDKLGSGGFRGDPASALLEVLDPEQNHAFVDNYLELPVDLSGVLFIATTNEVERIPEALIDRMEVIEIAGYTETERREIAIRHLVPKQLKEHGLEGKVEFSPAVVTAIAKGWTFEAGVRSFERKIATVCRKLATKVANGESGPFTVTLEDLAVYLGPRRFEGDELPEQDTVGLATAIVVTGAGGETCPIEVSRFSGKGNLKLTGQLGEVMQESAQTAYSWVRANAVRLGIDPAAFDESDIHLHVPEGATPKDGPSAGVTIATALTSVFGGIPVRRDVAMTGEITLSGRVLPIGGTKQKLIAAAAAGATRAIIPAKNARDLPEIPDEVKEKLEILPMSDAFEAVCAAIARRPEPFVPAPEPAAAPLIVAQAEAAVA
jgi:ATP-dependent Lon protease